MVCFWIIIYASDGLSLLHIARLQQLIKRPTTQELGQNDLRALVMLIFIVALLAENCNFDNLRQEHPSTSPKILIYLSCIITRF